MRDGNLSSAAQRNVNAVEYERNFRIKVRFSLGCVWISIYQCHQFGGWVRQNIFNIYNDIFSMFQHIFLINTQNVVSCSFSAVFHSRQYSNTIALFLLKFCILDCTIISQFMTSSTIKIRSATSSANVHIYRECRGYHLLLYDKHS